MFVLDIKGEAQAADQLCWAAVSTMAVRAFKSADFPPPSQLDLIAYKQAGIKTAAKLDDAKNPENEREQQLHQRLENAKRDCRNIDLVNATSEELWLFNLKSSRLPKGKVLSPEQFRFEFETRKRPVAIRWKYEGKKPTNGRIRTGDHALIIKGFNPDTEELLVFDPWPALSPDFPRDPIPAPHEKWIPYNTYLNPQSAAGMDAVARHEFDEFKLRRVGEQPPKRYPDFGTIPSRLTPGANHVRFGGDIRGLPEAIDKVMRRHVVRDSTGAVIHGPYTPGTPIPVVPVEASELIDAERDTDALFAPETSVVIVPVLNKHGALIDSIQFVHEPKPIGWRAGGYSNNKIASLLCHTRTLHTCDARDKRGFYLVSIPELCTFFVAHGFRGGCNVAALKKGGLQHLCGARETFSGLIKRVKSAPADRSSLATSRA